MVKYMNKRKTIDESLKELHERWNNPPENMVRPSYSSKKYGHITVHSTDITNEEAYKKLRNLGGDYVMNIRGKKVYASDLIKKEQEEIEFKIGFKKNLIRLVILLLGIFIGVLITKLKN